MLAIIDYGAGNLHSAAKALEKAANEVGFKGGVIVTNDAKIVAQATHIVLPGVGAYGDCKRVLDAVPDMIEALEKVVLENKKPFLGICVGMQMLSTRGLEHGEHKGLNWIKGDVSRITPDDKTLKVPHMGWNELEITQNHACLAGISSGNHVYYVHSYHFSAIDPVNLYAISSYGGKISAIVGRDNIIGTQFHPEKSQATGLKFLGNFLKWKP